MIKVFLIIAALVLGASAYFGIENRSKFVDTREEKDSLNKNIKKQIEKTDEEREKLIAQHGKLLERHKEYDAEVAKKERYIERTQEEQNKLNTANQTKSGLMAKKAEYDQVIADFEARFPDVDGIEGVVAKVEDMKTEKMELEAKQKELEVALTAMNARVAKNRKTIGVFDDRQAKRSQGIALNGTEGVITAVNQDWGFVVIGIGSNKGVTADSELIVKRGGEIVGKLSIASIEPRLTVADIRMDTLKDGARILPGDRVIFEKLQE